MQKKFFFKLRVGVWIQPKCFRSFRLNIINLFILAIIRLVRHPHFSLDSPGLHLLSQHSFHSQKHSHLGDKFCGHPNYNINKDSYAWNQIDLGSYPASATYPLHITYNLTRYWDYLSIYLLIYFKEGSSPSMEPSAELEFTTLRLRPDLISSHMLNPLSHPSAPNIDII